MSRTIKSEMPTDEALEKLRAWLPAGSTVYTVLRHVASSGMSRRISVHAIVDNNPLFLSGYAARVLDRRWNPDDGGILCQGAGMDMGFELVYSLSQKLYSDGYALSHRWL